MPARQGVAAWRGLLLALVLLAGPVHACRYAADTRPLATRLAEVPLAFVGRVVAVDQGVAVFEVETALRGRPGKQQRVEIADGSCAIRFHAGDRWLFAGASLPDPSWLLGPASAPLDDALAKLRAAGVTLPPGR